MQKKLLKALMLLSFTVAAWSQNARAMHSDPWLDYGFQLTNQSGTVRCTRCKKDFDSRCGVSSEMRTHMATCAQAAKEKSDAEEAELRKQLLKAQIAAASGASAAKPAGKK